MSLNPNILTQLELLKDGAPSDELNSIGFLSVPPSFTPFSSLSNYTESEPLQNSVHDTQPADGLLELFTPEETLTEYALSRFVSDSSEETGYYPLDASSKAPEFCQTFDDDCEYAVDEDFLSQLPIGSRSGCMVPNISAALGKRQDKHELKALEEFAMRELRFGVFGDQLCEFRPPCWKQLDSHTCTIRLKELFCKHKLDRHLGSSDYKELYRSLVTNPELQKGSIPDPPLHCINLLDCSLNLENFTFYEHSADDAFFHHLNVTRSDILDPGDGAVFESFIASASNGDPNVRQQILELTALACTGYQIKAFYVIEGPSGSGKSEYCRFLVELLGHQQIGSIAGIHELGSKFAMANMEDKRLAICMDLPNVPLPPAAIGTLKVATGNDAKNSQAKYKDSKTIFRGPLWLFASNYPLQIPRVESEDAFLKRMVIVPFLHAVPPEKQIQNLYKKLLEESPYILRESIYAYQKLLRNNFILTHSEVPAEYLPGESRENVVAVQEFLDTSCTFDPNATVSTERLYQAFMAHCPHGQAQHMTKIAYGKILAELLSGCDNVFEIKRTENSERRGYRGLRLQNEQMSI